MLCEEVIGTLEDPRFTGKKIDYVEIEWHEAFYRLHRKTTLGGMDIGIRMNHQVLHRGLRQNDVLYEDQDMVIAVDIPACDAIRAQVDKDHPQQIAKLCYEVGNTHTSMFRGEDDFVFYAPYHQALMDKLAKLHGVTTQKVQIRFDFDRALSSSINDHHH